MSIFEKHRYEIWNPGQHPYKHSVSEFAYINDALPGVTNVESALNWILAVLYPNALDAVATPGDLPAVGNTINDYRVVLDDGDGKSASYRFEQREGDASPKWYKIYDLDFGTDSVLSQFYLKTQDLYASKRGYDDRDSDGNLVTGTLAGQTIFGGATANKNLTLMANAGDGTGAQTGYVQVGDHFRPISDNSLDLGTNSEQFRNLYVGTTGNFGTSVIADTLTIAGGSITDSTGTISFGAVDLETTGTLASGNHTIGTLTIAGGSITDTSGAISFGNTNIETTGTLDSGTHTIGTLVLAAGSISDTNGTVDFNDDHITTSGNITGAVGTFTSLAVDNISLNGNTVSITNANGNLILVANGTGVIDFQSAVTSVDQTITGTLAVAGQLNADNLRLDGNTLSSTNLNGNIILDPNGTGLIEMGAALFPTTNSAWDLGKTGNVWNDLWIDGNLRDGTNTIAISTLMAFSNALVGVDTGYVLFYNAVSGKFEASLPDTEVDHGLVTGLSDDDHTQYALLAGRSGGQTLTGGTASGDDLTLQSTSHSTKGNIFFSSVPAPTTNASYSAGWSGTDIGDSTHYFKDVYTKGEHKGFRLENLTVATLPSASAQNVGRLVFATDNKKAYVDTGSSVIVLGASRYVSDLTFNGSDTSKDVDVSSTITDARNCIIQLLDNSNNYERIFCTLKATSASNVRIETSPALPAGSYRLIVLE